MKAKNLDVRTLVITAVVAIICAAVILLVVRRPAGSEEYSVIRKAQDFELINQNNETIHFESFLDKVKVMTFFYVKCPMPNMCPLTILNFRRLQESLEEYNKNTVLLSITFDPELDTPGMLNKYGQMYGADFDNWHFLTGSKQDIDKVCEDYGIIHERQEDGTIRHSVITYLVDQRNNIRKIYIANEWKPEDIREDVITLISEKN